MASQLTVNEIDGPAALHRFTKHLSNHLVSWNKPSSGFVVENFSMDPNALASLRCDVGIVQRDARGDRLIAFHGDAEALTAASAVDEVRANVARARLNVPLPDGKSQAEMEFIVISHDPSSDVQEAIREYVAKHQGMVAAFVASTLRFPSRDPLPIEPPRNPDNEFSDVAEDITALFERTLLKRRPAEKADADYWDKGGREVFRGSIHRYTSTNRRILFLLPAFPFKSSNTVSKVLGAVPDMGEYLAIERLDAFLDQIGQLYAPGAQLVLFSDGRVYCDLFRIDDATTSTFKNAMRSLYPAKHITWSDLDAFFEDFDDSSKRVALEGLFGACAERVNERIARDPDFLEVYCGFKKFMSEELTVQRTKMAHAGANSQLRATARGLMRRNFAYGIMMKVLFREHIRLSIHPSSNGNVNSQTGAKYAVNLVGVSDWGTPWHNCAYLAPDGSWHLVRRSTALQRGLRMLFSPQGLPYFVDEPAAAATNSEPAAATATRMPTSGDSEPADLTGTELASSSSDTNESD